MFYLHIFTSNINKNIVFFVICKYSKFMNSQVNPKTLAMIDRSSDKGLYVNDDDQDWGSAGMNDVQEDSQ